MFKHLKPFHLFENIQNDEDLLEIKDIVQDLVDDWDIQWVDEIDWAHIKDSDFIYNIRRVEGNKDWQILIDFILPDDEVHIEIGGVKDYDKLHNVYKNWNLFVKQIEECVQRLFRIGYEEVEWMRVDFLSYTTRQLQIVM
jgi:hypothetical protein